MVNVTSLQGPDTAPLGFLRSLTAITLLLVSACGGGGGSGSGGSGTGPGGGSGGASNTSPTPSPPTITVTLASFADNGSSLGLTAGSGNSEAQVKVTDDSYRPISTADVKINGVALSYDTSVQVYSGSLTIQPGDTVSVSVTVGAVTYTGTQQQFAAFPTIYAAPVIYAPTATTVWSTQMENSIAWSDVVSRPPNSVYLSGVLDSTGTLLWPGGGVLQKSVMSGPVTVPASSLTPGNRVILVGIVTAAGIPGARSDSSFTVSAFSYLPISVITFQPNPSPTPPLSESVGMHIDYAHAGRATIATGPPVFPSISAWVTTLNNNVSYPVIAEGKVFVLTDGSVAAGTGRSLYALDETNGSIIWGPVSLRLASTRYSAHAYDHGKIFVIDGDGLLSSYDAATGAAVWSESVSLAGFSAPTAVNGLVYVGAAGALYAIDERTGAIVWKATTPDGGTTSAPTVSADGVFVTATCHAYKFDPNTGNLLWSYSGPYSGASWGIPGVFAINRLYDLDELCMPLDGSILPGLTFDAATGMQTGTFNADRLPAFSDHAGFYMSNGTLTAIDQNSGNTLWSFAGDGHLTTAPIVVDDFVVVASSSGKVYALSADLGSVAWSATTASQIIYTEGAGNPAVLGGNGVGDGYLVVPAGNTVTAWRLVP